MNYRFARFFVVGLVNTAVNFLILNLAFYVLGQGKIKSIFIATSVALTVSFIMNRGFVFNARIVKAKYQILPFVIITAIGSLGIQSLVYIIVIHLIRGHEWLVGDTVRLLTGLKLSNDFIAINTSAGVGSLATMLWNYNGYRLFAFNQARPRYERIESNEKENSRP